MIIARDVKIVPRAADVLHTTFFLRSNKKTLYSTRSGVNWAFFGTRGPLKRE
jgi:hypothetical protein